MFTDKIPVARFAADGILIYSVFDGRSPRSEAQKENEKNLIRDNSFNGYMSPKTKSKVKKYLSCWVDSVMVLKTMKCQLAKRPYLTFVTLTLPSKQIHSDNEIKRHCLNHFIIQLKENHHVWEYFWRAEAQANGNIHFHLLIDSRIKWRVLRDMWNNCINKLGYVDRYSERMKSLSFKQYKSLPFNKLKSDGEVLKLYNSGTACGWTDPNSSDIHALNKVSSVQAYVIKYVTKTDNPDAPEYRKIQGRIWGSSDGIRNLTYYESLIDSKADRLLRRIEKDQDIKPLYFEECTVLAGNISKILQKYDKKVYRDILFHRVGQAKELYQNKKPDLFSDTEHDKKEDAEKTEDDAENKTEEKDFFAERKEKKERKELIQLEIFDSFGL